MVLPAKFDWDAGNRTKCEKHGVSVAEIEALFSTDPPMSPDELHSDAEQRFIVVGPNSNGRALFVVFTLRVVDGEEVVRPVSARFMHRKEFIRYAEKWWTQGPGDDD